MLSHLKSFMDKHLSIPENESSEHQAHRLQIASAALMFELIRTDHDVSDAEVAQLREIMQTQMSLSDSEADELLALAEERATKSVSLYEFTSLICEQYDHPERIRLIENLWLIAYSDKHLDKYEEMVIRKTADLIYVSHSDFIKAKLRAREAKGLS
ncbi:TerB family tellurite resistance protein [Pseudohongiella nitratireducens]|uniref:tellurite resistance TerB family protein n=1 Tax=Pseudohongiella nitratireducens TaxID=1768907 RepID=UPI0030EC1AD9|tara:strand:+ start:2843 stop:3310 length:468 start_codon:yes stop_codon:yes gene_type:complete